MEQDVGEKTDLDLSTARAVRRHEARAARLAARAHEELILSARPAALSLVGRFWRLGLEREELESVAMEAVCVAVRSFDPSHTSCAPFGGFVYPRIAHALAEYIARGGNRVIPIARDAGRELQRIHRVASELDPSRAPAQQAAAIAEVLGMTTEHVRDLLSTERTRAPMETVTVSITDHDTVDVAALAETRAQADLVMATLGASRDAEVVRLQFGLGGRAPMAQREIAATLGVSATTVAKAQTRVMAQLQERFAA